MDLSQLIDAFGAAMAAMALILLIGTIMGIRMDEAPPTMKRKPRRVTASETEIFLS